MSNRCILLYFVFNLGFFKYVIDELAGENTDVIFNFPQPIYNMSLETGNPLWLDELEFLI